MADEIYEGAIGIDLGNLIPGVASLELYLWLIVCAPPGTTYSCVANYEGTNVEISEFFFEGTRNVSFLVLTRFVQLPMSREAIRRLRSFLSPMRSVSLGNRRRIKLL
jgi:hypothetical protein